MDLPEFLPVHRKLLHTIKLDGIREKENYYSLVHPTAYYTLNNIPQGQKMSMNGVSTKNSSIADNSASSSSTSKSTTVKTSLAVKPSAEQAIDMKVNGKAPGYFDVKGLLVNYTCLSCHNPEKKLIGPSFTDIAKRKYSNDKIVELIHNPQPQNWPEYPTPMAPMPQVSREDGLKIAAYINSLR